VDSPGKTIERNTIFVGLATLYPFPTKNASIKWPVQVKPLKKHNLCWTGHFIPRPVQVKPLKIFGGINNVCKKHAICFSGLLSPTLRLVDVVKANWELLITVL
jgi:hypothetical protein